MRYLLDTTVWVDFLRGRSENLARRLRGTDPEEVALSAVGLAELRFGAAKCSRSAENQRQVQRLEEEVRILEFDSRAAQVYGELRALLERQGVPMGANDLLSASQAVSRRLTLVSSDPRACSALEGLRLEDWRAG